MNEGSFFCPNCGTKVKQSDTTCPNCGFDIATFNLQKNNLNVTNNSQTTDSTVVKKKKKHHPFLWILLILILLIGGGYLAGSTYYSKESQTSKLARDMSSGDTSRMESAAVDENKNKIDDDDLEPLEALFLQKPSQKRVVKRIIQNGSANTNFDVVKTGRYWGIFPKYRVQLKKQSIKLDTNVDDPTFSLNGNDVAYSHNASGYTLSPHLPGVYTVKIESLTNDKSVSKRITIPLAGEPEYNSLDVKVKKKTKKKTVKKTTDADENKKDNETDSDEDEDDDDNNDNVDKDELLGTWKNSDNDTSLIFNSDGTYETTDNSGESVNNGTFTINLIHNKTIYVTFQSESGDNTTDSFTVNDDSLYQEGQNIHWTK